MVVGLRKMHQRRGAGGGVRACGARARERAESSGAERGEDSRERQQRETASPMVLHCGILWERR